MGLFLLSGCVIAPVKRTAVFNPAEYEPCLKEGTATITGQAFVKTAGGDVKFAAGNIIYLNPITEYSSEFYQKAVVGGVKLEPALDAVPFPRQTVADGNGNFEFKNVPDCGYYLYTSIVWQIPTPYGLTYTGGAAYAKVKAKSNETVKVVVTR